MSSFTEPVSARFDPDLDPGVARLFPAWVYYLNWDDETEYVYMPDGQVSDGLSGPWFMRWMFQRWDQRTIKAARAHDQLYQFPFLCRTTSDVSRQITRKEADALFYDMLLLGGRDWVRRSSWRRYREVNWKLRCATAYYLLRAFGWVAWNRHRKNDKGGVRI